MSPTPQTPRHQRTRRGAELPTPSTVEKKRPDGLFRHGQWWCNCNPRKEAPLRLVQKDGPTKGRWFYTCEASYCKFFLWKDAAEKKEKKSHSTTDDEEEEVVPKPKDSQQRLTSFFTPGRRESEENLQLMDNSPCPPSSKRARGVFEEEQEQEQEQDGLFEAIGSDEEQELIALVDQSSSKPKQPAPRDVPQDPFVTPTAQRTTDMTNGLPTPSVSRNLFPSAKRQKTVSFDGQPPEPQTPSTNTTATVAAPTPSSAPQTSPTTPGDVTEEVMSLLRAEKINPPVLQSVRALLENSARKTRGVVLGRDNVRARLRERDVKVAELQGRVAALENKDKLNERQLTDTKAQLMNMYEKI